MSDSLYNSYFSTVTTERVSPSKKKTGQPQSSKKLSKSFTRQLAKTLGTTKKKKRTRKDQSTTKGSRKASPFAKSMSKRAASDSKDEPMSKKSKTNLPGKETDKDGQPFWEISGKRRLQLSEFKGTTMVGVREFYEKDGEALPGKKVSSLVQMSI